MKGSGEWLVTSRDRRRLATAILSDRTPRDGQQMLRHSRVFHEFSSSFIHGRVCRISRDERACPDYSYQARERKERTCYRRNMCERVGRNGTQRGDANSNRQGRRCLGSSHGQDSEISAQTFGAACSGLALVNPVVKYADSIRVNVGCVLCVPHGTNYSWLATQTFSTKEVLQSGVVSQNVCGKATASPQPGEIILFVRPLTVWEKLKQ